MCTVTHWPLQGGFILTSNRDENASRNAEKIQKTVSKSGEEIYYPVDKSSGGSWFAASDNGRCGCILNGAFAPYDVLQKWPKSRGLMLLELFEYSSATDFCREFDFESVAPFTLVFRTSDQLEVIRSSGTEFVRENLNSLQKYIWSSVTLYPEEIRNLRSNWFHKFVRDHPQASAEELFTFHSGQPFGDGENDFIMNRGGKVQTISITQMKCELSSGKLVHNDLVSGRNFTFRFN